VADRFELELENIPAYVEESYAPPEYMLKPHVDFYYSYSRLSAEQFWEAEPKNITKKVEDFLGRDGDAKAIAAKLVGADPKTTAKNIYAHVQGFRNYSYELEKTEQEMKKESISAAKNVADVLKKSAGYDEELNRAFVALARAAGLQAEVVRVAPRDTVFFSNKIADGDQLNDEVAMVTIGDETLLLDPGVPHAPFGTMSWEKTNVPGVRIVGKGKPAQWVMTPQGKPEDALTRRTADLKIDGENLTGKVVVTWTGQEALRRRLRTLTDAEAERTKNYEDIAKRWFADGATVKLASLEGATTFDGPLVATYDVTLPNMVSAAGSRTVVPLSVFAANAANPFAPTTRKHAMYFEYPRATQDEVKLTLPDDLKLSAVPVPVVMNAGTFGYTNEVKAAGQTLTYKRATFVNVMLVEAKNYGPLRNFYSAMLTADQEPIVLVAKE
ncbi:MAG TPA: transglutaminase-like domain-containing protein, partial [Thermoanaerobaculia bacterium]|nr:transglutaminase-like domain-containing protein [Thermoanaerobaculia bacterium]